MVVLFQSILAQYFISKPLKTLENRRFSDFFRGMEMTHWVKMG